MTKMEAKRRKKMIETVILPDGPTIPSVYDIKSFNSQPPQRAKEDAFLQTCQHTHVSEDSKNKPLFILDSLQCVPSAVTDALGVKQDALAHPSVLSKISGGSSYPRKKNDGNALRWSRVAYNI